MIFGRADAQTDLAIEAHELLRSSGLPVDGIEVDSRAEEGIAITRVRVATEEAAERMGRPVGTYITLECPGLRRRSQELRGRLAQALSRELAHLMDLPPRDEVLVVGLGNWRATPDALGPRVVGKLLVTRHLRGAVPADLMGRLRPVAACAPGVLGLTGIETGDIVRGIVGQTRPRAVIAIDALAARTLGRLGTTVQLADTGITPGSGVGNHRSGIDRASLGVPVLALGVPTVVRALAIAEETIDRLSETGYLSLPIPGARPPRPEELLGQAWGDYMVTPKEVDTLLEDLSELLAAGLNAALHPGWDEDLARALSF